MSAMDKAQYNDPSKGWRDISVAEAMLRFPKTVRANSFLFRCICCKEPVVFIDNEKGKQSPHFRHKNKSEADCELKMDIEEIGNGNNYESVKNEPIAEIGISKKEDKFLSFQIKLPSSICIKSASNVIFKSSNTNEKPDFYRINNQSETYSKWFDLYFIPFDMVEVCFDSAHSPILLEGIYDDCTIFKDTQHPEKISKKRDTILYYGESYLFLVSKNLFKNSIFGKFPESCILSRYGDLLLIKGILSYNGPLCQLLSRVGYSYPVFKAISNVVMWPPFLRVNKEIVNHEKGYFAENIYYEQVVSGIDPYLRNSYIAERDVNSNPLYKIVSEDDLSDNLLTIDPLTTKIEVKNKLDKLVMSQEIPTDLPSIKNFHFLPKYDGEIICLRKKVPVRKESFFAENDTVIPEDYIQKGNEIQILYGRDCVWQISFIGKQEEDSLDKYSESELKRLRYVILTSHGSLVKFDRKYMRIVENSKVISIDLKRILERYYLKGLIPLKVLRILCRLNNRG